MFAPQVTLTTASSVYNLNTLVKAIESTCPGYCGQLLIQSDPGNGSVNIYIGDSTVSTSKYGAKIVTSQSVNYNAPFNNLDLANFYLTCDGAGGALVNVEAVIY